MRGHLTTTQPGHANGMMAMLFQSNPPFSEPNLADLADILDIDTNPPDLRELGIEVDKSEEMDAAAQTDNEEPGPHCPIPPDHPAWPTEELEAKRKNWPRRRRGKRSRKGRHYYAQPDTPPETGEVEGDRWQRSPVPISMASPLHC